MNQRPSRKDTEDDLLRMQEEFLSSKNAPAAAVFRKPDKRHSSSSQESQEAQRDVVHMEAAPPANVSSETTPPQKKSRFKQQQASKWQKKEDPQDPEEMLERHDSHITKVLSEIKERTVGSRNVSFPTMPASGGFPAVLHRCSLQQRQNSAGKKKSLFAQQMSGKKLQDFGIQVVEQPSIPVALPDNVKRVHPMIDASSSSLVTGQGLSEAAANQEARRIHKENQDKLSNMTEEEILSEQKQLLKMLDPSLVAFLKSKRQAEHKPSPQSNADKTTVQAMDVEEGQTEQKPSRNVTEELPVKAEKSWVNMDNIEYEKLLWMKEMKAPSATDVKTDQPARFDFQGQLMAPDADLPTHLGLHHHGDEPERAGYTLDELFQLARSANMQQRVIAFNIISKVLHKARHGGYHGCTSVPIVPTLLNGGLVFLLRWALDDATENSLVAAVGCLHALLVCTEDEEAADEVFRWPHGDSVPTLQGTLPEDAGGEEDVDNENKAQQTDQDVVQSDVIQGLVRMQLLDRLRYILDTWRPGALVVIQTLDILIRIARHTTEAAFKIFQCQELVDCIIKHFLPLTWQPVDVTVQLGNVYGVPVPRAVKFLRLLASAGRNMAATLVSSKGIMGQILRYISVPTSDLGLHTEEAQELQIESLRIWRVFSSYGLTDVFFVDTYSVIIEQVAALSNVPLRCEQMTANRLVALLGVVQAQVDVAASAVTIAHQNRLIQQRMKDTPEGKEQTMKPIPAVNWSHVTGFIQSVEGYFKRSVEDFIQHYQHQRHDVRLPACVINLLSTYLSHVSKQPGYSAVETLQWVEQLCEQQILPLLKSIAFKKLLIELRENSLILHKEAAPSPEIPANLPLFGALFNNKGEGCPLLLAHGAICLLLAVLRLVWKVGQLHKGMAPKLFQLLLSDLDLLTYCRHVCQVKQVQHAGNHFVSIENWIQYYIVKMAAQQEDCDAGLYHQVSLLLLTRLHAGDEHLAHELLSTVLFSPNLLRDVKPSENSELADLHLKEKTPLSSATGELISATRGQLLSDISGNLGDIRATFITCVGQQAGNVSQSRSRILRVPHETLCLMKGQAGQLLVPVDWVYLPLIQLYAQAASPDRPVSEESVPEPVIARVARTLQFVYCLETIRPGILDSVSIATKISRLICVFLAGSDLFLDGRVHIYLSSLLKEYSRPSLLEKIDFIKPIPGLVAFYDLYIMLLQQYEAVSFGDSLFCCFVLLPLQQRHDKTLRQAVWGEHAAVLRSLFIPLKELVFPLDAYLYPEENDLKLLRQYMQALLAGTVQPRWSPLMYLIAVHHANRFMYTQDGVHQTLKQAFIKQTLACKNQVLQNQLLYYKQANLECEGGMELYATLPSSRQRTLDSVQGQGEKT